jgi:hypothetical protein
MERTRTLKETYDLVEQKIQEAIAKGEFDHLPGEGKPIELDENPFVPADWRLAHKMLKDNAVAPEFVLRLKSVESIREEMARTASESLLRRLATRLAAEVEALNSALLREEQFRRTSLQLAPVDVEAEVARYRRGQMPSRPAVAPETG